MKAEWILYPAILIIVFAFLLLMYIYIEYLKKMVVTKKVESYIKEAHTKIDYEEAKKRLDYIDENKKYISLSLYKKSTGRIKRFYQVL